VRSTDPALILLAGVGASFDFDFNDYLHIASLSALPQPCATARNVQNPDLVHFPLGNFLTSSVIIVSPVSGDRLRANNIWSNGNQQASVTDNGKRVLRLGLDVHYRQVTVAIQEDGGRIKAAGRMKHPVFLDWIQKKLDQGWEIYSCYEAGASGYWLHRRLEQIGVQNLVVVPKAMGQGGKKQKTDKRDAGELCDSLDRYLRGHDKALSVVRV